MAEIEAEGGVAAAVVADCRDDAQVDAMVRETVERLGGLDFAVNNIGMIPKGRTVKPFVEYRGDDWRDIVDQNLTLAALSARAEAEVMLDRGTGGVIVFVSSGETTRPSPLNSIYAAAKAALNHLVTSMAVELGPAGIRVLAVAPGTTLTETVREAFTDEHVAAIVESTALKRMVEHDELGRLCVFLTQRPGPVRDRSADPGRRRRVPLADPAPQPDPRRDPAVPRPGGADMIDPDALTPALDEIRSLVQADGGDMLLTSVVDGTVNLQLVVEGASCVECVMPREFLEQIALDMLRGQAPEVGAVSIDDPREHPDFVTPDH